jgi:hypothetical protein
MPYPELAELAELMTTVLKLAVEARLTDERFGRPEETAGYRPPNFYIKGADTTLYAFKLVWFDLVSAHLLENKIREWGASPIPFIRATELAKTKAEALK